MENVRYNISPCSSAEVTEFIRKIDSKTFAPNGTVSATDKSHYDRYSYLAGDSRIAVVYDTSACILSITGRSDHALKLLDLFGPGDKTVKRSTVPAQGSTPNQKREQQARELKQTQDSSTRAKLFVSPDRIRRRTEFAPVPTIFVSSKGAEISTDEIYPPQTIKKKDRAAIASNNEQQQSGDVIYPPQVVKKRTLPSYGEGRLLTQPAPIAQKQVVFHRTPGTYGFSQNPARVENKAETAEQTPRQVGIAITVNRTNTGAPRRAVISFGSEDDSKDKGDTLKITTRTQPQQQDEKTEKRKRGRPPKNNSGTITQAQTPPATEKRKRGRPPKNAKNEVTADIVQSSIPEYKNGYSVKNFPFEALSDAIKRLKSYGKTVNTGETEFAGTIQEVKNYTVSDAEGQKVLLRYATKRMTLQLQGKRSKLFGEVMSQVSNYSDYSSALENYVEESGGGKNGKKVSDVQNKLKMRLPTAYEYLSEQSRIDFSYGIHDFSQSNLHLSDYSVLLVPAFRGLERFVFDLQIVEDIKVKMIGQAFDKDDSGKYILKSGYTQRIDSVIYAEVLVALYSEYFAQRNFFAHSDNTDSNMSRSIPERAAAQKIFDHLLDVVEYNAKKLKEIGFSINNK
ncbi:MAG: hypothetical protein K2L88_00030 [Clostridiales bacterium]|nr:hypothetical protein [Clostridiales bacterium]